MPTALLWLRRDLRLNDLPALGAAHAAADGGRVLPVFVLDPRLTELSAVRTHCLISALAAAQKAYDGAIVIRTGSPEGVIPELVREVEADSVHISAESTPFGRARDEKVRDALPESVSLVATGCAYAVGPGTIVNGTGGPYKVFTPFSKAWRAHGWPAPATVPEDLRWYRQVESEDLPELPDLPEGLELPEVGEQAALERWHDFLDVVGDYKDERDRPDHDGTSQLSVQLKYGTIHPRTLLADLASRRSDGSYTFTTELAWREFYADVLWQNPASAWHDLKPALSSMSYDDPAKDQGTAELLTAWQEGRTGYPFVDAGMRQLLTEGWMHNRVRMVTASFLCKHLHIWWPHGAAHFMEYLRDGDIASNNHGWQWVAGTGTDAAPYFRIFNPTTQGQRFDPDGAYVRTYVPELRHLSGKAVHEPWKAADGYEHGYPEPIVEHKEARAEALSRYESGRS